MAWIHRERVRIVLAAAVLAGACAGWWTFGFLTDDAYIEFRYASNLVFGRGLVWNPAPFVPVEGYTSFLWVVLLALVWRVFGVEPPDSANVLGLLCGLGSLAFSWAWLERLPLGPRLAAHRNGLVALAMFGTLSNRTFLAWMSSGLETALFNVCFVGWFYLATSPTRSIARLAGVATAAALTRPEGWLAVVGTVALAIMDATGARRPAVIVGLAPVGVGVAHLVWRRWCYGEWVPNTYYAKHVAAWPEAGARYLASFVFEYGVEVWLALLVLAAGFAIWNRQVPSASLLVVVAVAAIHVGYYTFVIGGDHFEYRVYSWFVPLLYVSAVALAASLGDRPWVVYGAVFAFVGLGLPIPWTHWARTHEMNSRRATHVLVVPVADAFPEPVRSAVARWDGLQSWLIAHHVGMRHQEHAVFGRNRAARLPTRAEGEIVPWEPGHPVIADGAVGVLGWVLPNVAIIDTFGLNDRVVARTVRTDTHGERLMAHDRAAPPGYVECFAANVTLKDHVVTVSPRSMELTDDAIRRCESRE